MPTLPKGNALADPTPNPSDPGSLDDHQKQEAARHSPTVYLGELASDPANIPDDRVTRIWTTGGQLKCSIRGVTSVIAPYSGPNLARASGNLTLSTSLQDVSGATLSLPAGQYLIFGVFALVISATGPGQLEGHLDVGGVDQTGVALFGDPGVTHFGTVAQAWIVTLGSLTTVKLRAKKNGAGGTATCNADHTCIVAFIPAGAAVAKGSGAHDHTGADGSGVLTADEHDSYSEYAEIATPGNPASGKVRLYPKSDHLLYRKDSTGAEAWVGAGPASGDLSGNLPAPTVVQASGAFALPGDIADTLSGSVNNYAPGSLSTASVLRITSTGAWTITGLTGGAPGRILTLVNFGSNTIKLVDDDAGSSAANRFYLRRAAGLMLYPKDAVTLIYDDAAASGVGRWRPLGITSDYISELLALNNWKVLYTKAGAVTELALGADGTYLRSAGAAADPTFSAIPIADVPKQTRMIVALIDPTAASTSAAKAVVGPMPVDGTFVEVTIKCKEGETNGATSQIVDVHLQTAANENTDTTTTIWSTQANRPTITNTNKAGSSASFNTTQFSKGDWLYIYSDQLGTGLTALSVGIEFTPR